MKKLLTILLLLLTQLNVYAIDTYMSPELFRSYGKQQQRAKDYKGNKIVVTPHYNNYNDRKANVTATIVNIYNKHTPA